MTGAPRVSLTAEEDRSTPHTRETRTVRRLLLSRSHASGYP